MIMWLLHPGVRGLGAAALSLAAFPLTSVPLRGAALRRVDTLRAAGLTAPVLWFAGGAGGTLRFVLSFQHVTALSIFSPLCFCTGVMLPVCSNSSRDWDENQTPAASSRALCQGRVCQRQCCSLLCRSRSEWWHFCRDLGGPGDQG